MFCLQCISPGSAILALALKGVAFCLGTCFGAASCYVDGGCGTFAVFVVGTVVGFAVDLDGFASTAIFGTVHGIGSTLAETAAGSFFCVSGAFAHYVDLTSGTELVFIVETSCGRTF